MRNHTTIYQLELSNYIENHDLTTMIQGQGVAFLVPVVLKDGSIRFEWDYVETYNQARQALGY